MWNWCSIRDVDIAHRVANDLFGMWRNRVRTSEPTPTPDLVPYCTAAQLAARLGVTRQALWALVRRGTVPAPLRLSVRVSVWDSDTAAEIVRARHSHTQERKNAGAVRKQLRLARLKRQYAPETVEQRRAEIARLERGTP
jgi:predicted DNA-binding transcriptional regulator AlpA